jgi:hypothetical protein
MNSDDSIGRSKIRYERTFPQSYSLENSNASHKLDDAMMNQQPIKIEWLKDPNREWTRLFGGTVSEVWRSGDIVRRRRGKHEDAIVQLLTWLRKHKIPAIPEVIAISDQSVYLRYTEESVLRPWSNTVKTDSWLFQLGEWLSRSHTAMHGFQLQAGASFISGPATPEPGMVVCHGAMEIPSKGR